MSVSASGTTTYAVASTAVGSRPTDTSIVTGIGVRDASAAAAGSSPAAGRDQVVAFAAAIAGLAADCDSSAVAASPFARARRAAFLRLRGLWIVVRSFSSRARKGSVHGDSD